MNSAYVMLKTLDLILHMIYCYIILLLNTFFLKLQSNNSPAHYWIE